MNSYEMKIFEEAISSSNKEYAPRAILIFDILRSCGILDENILNSCLLMYSDDIEDSKFNSIVLGFKKDLNILNPIDELLTINKVSHSVRLIKIAEKILNIRSLIFQKSISNRENVNGYMIWNLRVVSSIMASIANQDLDYPNDFIESVELLTIMFFEKYEEAKLIFPYEQNNSDLIYYNYINNININI